MGRKRSFAKALWIIIRISWRSKKTLLLRLRGLKDRGLFDLGDVLQDELAAIAHRREVLQGPSSAGQTAGELKRLQGSVEEKLQAYRSAVEALSPPLSALCLSGGGIRSAAFALGVVQGLAHRGLLARFDYLSTVSGGGYMGSFLTAWVQRSGYARVCADLNGQFNPDELSPLQYLRRYTSYLTPRKGYFSADTLTVIAHYVRNLFLNWLIIIPLVGCALILLKLLAAIIWSIPPSSAAVSVFGALAIGLTGIACVEGLRQRPGWQNVRYSNEKFQLNVKWPLFLGALAASCAALQFHQLPGANSAGSGFVTRLLGVQSAIGSTVIAVSVLVSAIMFIAWMFAFFIARPPTPQQMNQRANVRANWRSATLSLGSFALSGGVTGAVLGALLYTSSVWRNDPRVSSFALLCLGPPMLVAALFLGETIYVGLVSYMKWGDSEREWVATAAGYHGRLAVTWMLLTMIVFGGSFVVVDFYRSGAGNGFFPNVKLSSLTAVGGISGIIVALLGKASSTAATMRERYNTWKNLSAGIILAIAAPVFLIVSLSALSAAIDLVVAGESQLFPLRESIPLTADSAPDLIGKMNAFYKSIIEPLAFLFLILAAIGAGASYAINTNRFSLHGLYRNRLIRAFLGASRASEIGGTAHLSGQMGQVRRPDPLTGFDERDNINLCRVWPNTVVPSTPPQLLVINCALNVLATSELSWQERKALSFTATPRSAGAGALHSGKGYFRSSQEYSDEMSLGGAITISGAAVSPNMGYHSSSTLSLLLTFFNVRLGAWLGNPGPTGISMYTGVRIYRKQGPVFSTMPLIQEALGWTTEDGRYVYLSDGGHFENLGLYEMIRRRCRLIVLSDAGCDASMTFEDLGNAAKKISIDLNVRIVFDSLNIGPRTAPTGVASAVATIIYPEPDAPDGRLLYLKPVYLGEEPASVRSYALDNPSFPHEPTTDQLFGEAQFEAYRALGEYIVQSVVDDPDKSYAEIRRFIEDAAKRLKRKAKSGRSL